MLDLFRRKANGRAPQLRDNVPAAWTPEAQQKLLAYVQAQKAAGAAPAAILAYLRATDDYQEGQLTELYLKQAFDAVGLPYAAPAAASGPPTQAGFTWTKPRIAAAVAGGVFLLALTAFAVSRVRRTN